MSEPYAVAMTNRAAYVIAAAILATGALALIGNHAPHPVTPELKRFEDPETGVICFVATFRDTLGVACGFAPTLIPTDPSWQPPRRG